MRILFIFSLLCLSLHLNGQNIFDEKNSIKYAQYLLNTHQYELAAEEFEKLFYLQKNKSEFAQKILLSYRLAEKYDLGLSRYQFLPDSIKKNSKIRHEYIATMAEAEYYNQLTLELQKNNTFQEQTNKKQLLSAYMLDKKYIEAQNFATKNQLNDSIFNSFLIEYQNLKTKNAIIASVFSSFVPGLGKAYAGQWKDGLMSLVLISGTAFQAYRGFQKSGNKSVYGWIYSSISLSFYFGNIYGSAQATKHYNQHVYNDYYKKVYSMYSPSFR